MNIDALDREGPSGLKSAIESNTGVHQAKPKPREASAVEICDLLEQLIEITRDGEEGFSHGAKYLNDRGLRDEFNEYSRERGNFVSELQRLERNYGKRQVDYAGSITGMFHRAWMNIRDAVMLRDDQAILEEAERGEEAAAEAYEQALLFEPPLPASVYGILEAMANKVQRTNDRICQLRKSGRFARKVAA